MKKLLLLALVLTSVNLIAQDYYQRVIPVVTDSMEIHMNTVDSTITFVENIYDNEFVWEEKMTSYHSKGNNITVETDKIVYTLFENGYLLNSKLTNTFEIKYFSRSVINYYFYGDYGF